jgi:hypothetical protein
MYSCPKIGANTLWGWTLSTSSRQNWWRNGQLHGEKYRLNLRNVHPTINEKSVQDLMNGPLTSLIFTVRDPVDRFVSMFNWRLKDREMMDEIWN